MTEDNQEKLGASTEDQIKFMQAAIDEANKAAAIGEVPIGAVVVYKGEIIGRGHNLRETSQNATTHAEMIAIQEANKNRDSWRLMDADLYVTLEPCPMCSGAMIQSRVRHVYFGAYDQKGGTAGTLMNLLQDSRFNHQVGVTGSLMHDECQKLLQDFFAALRIKRKNASRKPKLDA
ncbi:tRNA adenosine(34) deaminase TadA [Aerococcus sp. 1KP-2016]|jgi:tRNA(adenine34) deaminase|uniref:tRNA adenosine(34) deaminase TadA n=1 Tax=Aerococcus sp. 1KP-2016 TaxID=1981982 RepID=UPI000B98C503|nr:tRNA adenosine(34) deaminase TadA [Aerococcus sp. 1KP-2016]OYQ65671.1 tRNA-specific adenosine deaminase [Aerococcus sp. 1KP-2016]